MRAMVPKLLDVPRARDPDHQPEVPVAPGLDASDGILDDDRARGGPPPGCCAARRKVSGAGLPARWCAWIVLPSTRTSKQASNLVAFKTTSQFLLEVTTRIF